MKKLLCAATLLAAASAAAETPHDAGHAATVSATIKASGPLEVGKPAEFTLSLRTKEGGKPVGHPELVEVHTEKVHLLMVDPSLEDYHHEHPKPAAQPGDFTFTITPRRAGTYTLFADLKPVATGMQEYAATTFTVAGEAAPVSRETWMARSHEGIEWSLALDGPITAKRAIPGKMFASKSGEPFAAFEPVMGAYAHFVAFSENLKHVVHIHPLGEEPHSADQRGTSPFEFNVVFPEAGYYRFYAQTRIGAKDVFVPFGIMAAEPAKPKDAAELFARVDTQLASLHQAIATKQLGKVHSLAFETRDTVASLPEVAKLADPAAASKLQSFVKRIEISARLLDKFGDAGDSAQTKVVLARFEEDLNKLREMAGQPKLDIKWAENDKCPVSGEAVGSMAAGGFFDHKGVRYTLCCPSCLGALEKDPAAYIK